MRNQEQDKTNYFLQKRTGSAVYFPILDRQSVPKPPPAPPTKKRKRVMEEPPVGQAPKPLLSGAVPLEAFLALLQKVGVFIFHLILES